MKDRDGYWQESARGDFRGEWARDSRDDLGGYYARERMSYRGRGPKNWRRPDDRISDEVHHRLTDDHDIDASEITVRVENGEVTLEGTVHSREERRLAEDIAFACRGVHDVHNRLMVSDVLIGKASE